MMELLVLADDLTGALDTGVQFALQSIPTVVSTRIEILDQGAEEETSVIVLDLETRHLVPAAAADRVRQAVERALSVGVRFFYKKTDSTLRGNIGSELTALLEAAGGSILPFVPAYPAAGRTTVAGRQFVQGVPVHLIAYAEDPQNPVRRSFVPDIIAAQSRTPVVVANSDDTQQLPIPPVGIRIVVFDAQHEQDLRRIAQRLKRLGLIRISAGCAGFAAHLARVLALRSRRMRKLTYPSQILVVCGSTNPVSLEQIETAVQTGMRRIVLKPQQLLDPSDRRSENGLVSQIQEILSRGDDLILQTARVEGDIRRFHDYLLEQDFPAQTVHRLLMEELGHLVGKILHSRPGLTLIVFGGDTAYGIVKDLGAVRIAPIGQIAPGIVFSRLSGNGFDLPLFSKAGGLGAPLVIRQIKDFVLSA